MLKNGMDKLARHRASEIISIAGVPGFEPAISGYLLLADYEFRRVRRAPAQ
jgi:hypothetical protein